MMQVLQIFLVTLKTGITDIINMTTALLITDPKTKIEHKVKIMSHVIEGGIQVITHGCDDDWLPINLLGSAYKTETEADHHKLIRDGAIEKGTFVLNESTNPELNPELYNSADEEE
jgi:hypothetical protein